MKPGRPQVRKLLRQSRSYTCFTLLELVVVVAIVALLAWLTIPRFLESRCRAIITRFLGDLETLKTNIAGGLISAQAASDRLRDLMQKFRDEIMKSGCFTDADRQAIFEKLRAINEEIEQKVVSTDPPEKTIWERMKERILEILG